MIVNGSFLMLKKPLNPMVGTKVKEHGVSYGLGEAGYDIRIKQDVYLDRDERFVLASTIEEFDMPSDLVGIVHDKSTWARQGLSIFNTVIESGWKGFLTLELAYHGNHGLYIPAGAGIAQVLFHEIKQPCNYMGKYQNQADEPVGSKFE